MVPRRRFAAIAAVLLVSCSSESGTLRETAVQPVLTAQPAATTSTTTQPAATTPTTTPTTTTDLLSVTLPSPMPAPDPDAIEPEVELGTIEIPRLDLNDSFFEGVALATLDLGPGHWPGTAQPGTVGNVVIGGHRTSKGRPFRHLEQLVPGDEVIFTTGAGRFVYHVIRTEIVTPDSLWIVDQTYAYTATLFACHPVGSTKERIVVFLELAA